MGLYYLCSENKGADQLCGYREADLRLCFHICKEPVFSRRGSYLSGYPPVINNVNMKLRHCLFSDTESETYMAQYTYSSYKTRIHIIFFKLDVYPEIV